MRRVVASILVIIGYIVLLPAASSAAANTLHLSIKPIVCVVNAVQDGTGQSVSLPSPDCAAAILQSQETELAASLFDARLVSQKESGLTIPPRQSNDPGSTVLLQDRKADPVGRLDPATLIIAISVTTMTITLGADAAFFRLRYAKRTLGWLHARTIAHFIK